MLRSVAALLAGPPARESWRVAGSRHLWRVLAGAPLLLLALASLVAGAAGVLTIAPARLAGLALHHGPDVLGAVLLGGLLAWPAYLARPGAVWLLPAWLAVACGAETAGLFGLPRGLAACATVLPILVVGLAGIAGRIPRPLWESAAASGADRRLALTYLWPLAWPAVLYVALCAVLLAVGVLDAAGLSDTAAK